MSEQLTRKIQLFKVLRIKRIVVCALIVVGLGAEAIPEQVAKIIVVPCLVGAILIEAIVGE